MTSASPDRRGREPVRPPNPPRIGVALLRRFADPEIGNWLLSDLAYRHRQLESTVGRRRAHRWYWRQVFHGLARIPRSPRIALMKTAALVASIAQDVRFSLRQLLLRQPLPTLIALFTLAVGIGANTLIVGVLDAVLLRPLPFADADRLVMLWGDTGRGNVTWISPMEYFDYRDELADEAAVATFTDIPRTLSGQGEPQRVAAAAVSANYFDVMGVEAALGRTFAADEDGPAAPQVALISDELFRNYYGSDPSLVGSEIPVNGVAHTLIGVLPPGIRLPIDYRAGARTELYLPQPYDRSNLTHRGARDFHVVARLHDDVSLASARLALRALHERWESEGLMGNGHVGPGLVSVRAFLFGEVRPMLLVLLGAAGFVLAIACANVATLLLARGEARRCEIGVRVALGAGRARVLRQMLTESVTLALLGGLLGLGVAALGVRFVRRWGPSHVPRLADVSVDSGLLLIALGISLLTGFVFGLLPALHAARSEAKDLLAGAAPGLAHGRRGGRRGLLVGELALALMLAVAALLLIRSFANIHAIDPGFEPEGVLTMRIELPGSDYPDNSAEERFWEQVVERIQSVPGVTAAGAVRRLPLASRIGDWSITIEGRTKAPGENPNGDFQVVTAGYLEAMGIELVRGRLLSAADRAEAVPVVVLSEAMAETYWPGEEVLGKRFRIGDENTPWYTVVGVVGGAKHNTILEAPRTEMYHTVPQFGLAGGVPSGMSLVIRTAGDPLQALGPVREVIRGLDPNLPVADVRTMQEVVASASADTRFAAALLTTFGIVAVVLAASGIYGAVSYSVRQRTHEIGIRMAIGSAANRVVLDIVRESVVLLGLGLAFGLLGALALGRALQSLLVGVSPSDPLALLLVAATVSAVTLVAAYVPARRAAGIEPVVAIRNG